MTEKQFQAIVLELAALYRWLAYHTFDSRHSQPGFPDLVLIRPGELLFVELKSDCGRLSEAQRDWGDLLTTIAADAAAAVEYFVWRPRDFEAAKTRLARPAPFRR